MLCEKSNALWQPLLTNGIYKSLDDGFDDYFGIGARRKAESWRKKPNLRAQVNLETWSQTICERLGIEARKDLFNETVRASTFGEILGLGPFGLRYLFDTFYSDINKSAFSSLVFDARKAEQIVRNYSGEYQVNFRSEITHSASMGKLEVRYFIPVGLDALHSKKFKIRCKLDLPSLVETEMDLLVESFEYDGYLSQSQNTLSFHFESRVDAWEPRSLMLILPTHSNDGTFEGRFLKTPFGATDQGLAGHVSMKLASRHNSIILPHSNLQEVG